jgi:alpha-galactosidase
MPTKVVIIGAGSYVFTPSIVHDLIVKHRLDDLDLHFVDPDVEIAADMAGLALRMAAESGVSITTNATADRREALPGAHFVSTSVAVQGWRRWKIDRDVTTKYGIDEIIGELGGVGGLSYTLRQVPLMLAICRDMEDLCPDAILLNVSNPLPRILSAITSYTTIKAYGLCNAACGGVGEYDHLARLLERPSSSFHAVSAGVNHFNWLLTIKDRATGQDLYPALRDAVFAKGFGRLSQHLLEYYNHLPLSGDSHVGEFLPWDPDTMRRNDEAFHGSADERDRRRRDLKRMAAGETPWQPLLEHRAWEKPADIIEAIVRGKTLRMCMLNFRNNAAMPEVADEAVVEMPAIVERGEIRPVHVPELPPGVEDLIVKTSKINTMAAHAAAKADRDLLHQCIDLDPAITCKDAAHNAIIDLLKLHADILPQWQ